MICVCDHPYMNLPTMDLMSANHRLPHILLILAVIHARDVTDLEQSDAIPTQCFIRDS